MNRNFVDCHWFVYSLRTLVLSSDSTSSLVTSSRKSRYLDGIRLDAGADLLNHYQFHWCRMREASERNYKLADVFCFCCNIFFSIFLLKIDLQEADKAISCVAAYVNCQHLLVTSLTNNLSSISQMTEQLQKLTHSLGNVKTIVD